MASAFHMQSFYRTGSLGIDAASAQKYFDDEDGILDDNILDHNAIDSGLEMSPNMAGSRRESFAVGGSLFSPKHEDWQSAVDMQSVPSNNPFFDNQPHSNNPFFNQAAQQQQQQQSSFGGAASAAHGQGQTQGQGQWSISSSGSATPVQQYDSLSADYDDGSPVFQPRPAVGQTPFSNPNNAVAMFSSVSNGAAADQKDSWMTAGVMARKARPASPAIRSHNEMRRGDGIRKKNARFEIPAERNLSNIDQLIANSTDDAEIKELKQQKRLLRNRQAALDSRQRKKQHTERLEDEKKQYNSQITVMEDRMREMELQMQGLMRENQHLNTCVQTLKFEKEEMIQDHTIETGDLRKKIEVLTNIVENESMAGMAPASGFGGSYSDMDGIAMGDSWDSMGMFADYTMEPEVKQEMHVIPTPTSTTSHSAANPKKSDSSDDKPASNGGLLFMAFLVGAYFLSKQSPPSLPKVSEDLRVASASLLENVLQDAGVPQVAAQDAIVAQPTATGGWGATTSPAVHVHGTGLDGVAPSMLGDLTDTLTQPTQEQANEQLFGLTPAQYNGVQSQDFLQNPPARGHVPSQGRKNLADALSSMRKNGKAEVYTRSLLFDQIPSDVVRQFAQLVSDSKNAAAAAGDVNRAHQPSAVTAES